MKRTFYFRFRIYFVKILLLENLSVYFLYNFLKILFLINNIDPTYCNSRILQSPMITDWGSWGKWDKCPLGSYVIGMQLKVESKQQFIHDDTGLNGIRFICSTILLSTNNNDNNKESSIESLVGPWGSWRSISYCKNGIVVGFQLRSEASQGKKGDDTAANNLRILCSDGSIIEGDGTSWGLWTSPQKCPKRTAICAVQTQVEMNQKGFGTYPFGGDNTALNNLNAACCEIQNPAQNCSPAKYFELVSECDNTAAFTPTTCTYERRIGAEYNSDIDNNNLERTIFEDVGFSLGFQAPILANKFRHKTSLTNLNDSPSSRFSSSKSNHEVSTKIAFDVPPGVKTQIIQTIATCGFYLVRTAKFQRIDSIETLPEHVSHVNESSIHNNNNSY